MRSKPSPRCVRGLVVVALGGNALAEDERELDVAAQRRRLAAAAAALAGATETNRLVITHGSGPQVGLLALRNDAYPGTPPDPLDVLDAETEGQIGYLIEDALDRYLPAGSLAALLTQVVVDAEDPAFVHPTKPIGPDYDEEDARSLTAMRRWSFHPHGQWWRRVVASPEPKGIVELPAILALLEAGLTVICAGGGGIPVVADPLGGYRGVQAVIDKDLSASLLATELGAQRLVILTSVDAVYDGWGTPGQTRISEATPEELRARTFPAGSMGPKVEAACRFVEAGGEWAVIGNLTQAEAVIAGKAGTVVRAATVGAVG